MGITTGGAITAVIDRLEKAGYVKRTRDPDDRRRVIIELVPESLGRFGRYFGPVGAAFGQMSDTLDEDGLQLLLDWIQDNNEMMPKVIDEVRRMP
jgi:hypothetical protein